MKSYQFRFNNRSKTSAILVWFFTVLLAITLTTTLFLVRPAHDLSSWLLLILFPFLLIAIYRLFKTASERQSTEILTLNRDGIAKEKFLDSLIQWAFILLGVNSPICFLAFCLQCSKYVRISDLVYVRSYSNRNNDVWKC